MPCGGILHTLQMISLLLLVGRYYQCIRKQFVNIIRYDGTGSSYTSIELHHETEMICVGCQS